MIEKDVMNDRDGKFGGVAPAPRAHFFWSYLDLKGHEHGPFETSVMIEWHRGGYFCDDTLIRLWPHGWTELHLVASCITDGADWQSGHESNVINSVSQGSTENGAHCVSKDKNNTTTINNEYHTLHPSDWYDLSRHGC